MTYDQWKTTDPREYEREEEEQPTELELAYRRIRELERQINEAPKDQERLMKKVLEYLDRDNVFGDHFSQYEVKQITALLGVKIK